MPEELSITNIYGIETAARTKVDCVTIGNGRAGNIICSRSLSRYQIILNRVFPENLARLRTQRVQIAIIAWCKERALMGNQLAGSQLRLEYSLPIDRAILRVHCVDVCLLHLAGNLWAGKEHIGI